MTRGRKPKPEALKELAGNPGKRAPKTGVMQPQPAGTRAPTGMSDDARRYWHSVGHELVRIGILSIVDIPAFILMAEHYALGRRAADEINNAEGLTTVDKNGAERKHPLLQVFKDNSTAYRMFAAEFGLTPASRSRLNVAPPDAEQLSLAEELFGLISAAEDSDDDD